MTIMAASLPYFRLVVKEVSARSKARYARGYRLDEVSSNSGGGGLIKSCSSRIYRSGRTVIVQSDNNGQPDDSSDKFILNPADNMSNAIIQTNQVTVEYQVADLENSFGPRVHR